LSNSLLLADDKIIIQTWEEEVQKPLFTQENLGEDFHMTVSLKNK